MLSSIGEGDRLAAPLADGPRLWYGTSGSTRPDDEMRVPQPLPDTVPSDPLVEPDVHAHGFRQAREARRLELVEDYVELISDLIRAGGEARQVDIAARLGVAQPTVAKMLRRLADEGLVSQRPYRGVFLTEAGEAVAEAARARHHIVESFLLALGVSPEAARRDAEGIEHHVGDETLEAFQAFVNQDKRRGRPKLPS